MFNNLPEQLFSPAKIIYLGYLLSIYFDKYSFNGKNFIIASVIFFIFEIIHNDFLRIWLNHKACKECQKCKGIKQS